MSHWSSVRIKSLFFSRLEGSISNLESWQLRVLELEFKKSPNSWTDNDIKPFRTMSANIQSQFIKISKICVWIVNCEENFS